MAYVANDSSNSLFVISSVDGTRWSGDIVTNHQSKAAPALAVFPLAPGLEGLWMAYVANDSSNSLFVINSGTGTRWSGEIVTDFQSKAAPALAVFNGRLWMAFVANDASNSLFLIHSRPTGGRSGPAASCPIRAKRRQGSIGSATI